VWFRNFGTANPHIDVASWADVEAAKSDIAASENMIDSQKRRYQSRNLGKAVDAGWTSMLF
jgi:hypothetical protein